MQKIKKWKQRKEYNPKRPKKKILKKKEKHTYPNNVFIKIGKKKEKTEKKNVWKERHIKTNEQ